MSKQMVILALAAMALAACGSVPQHKVETRDTPAPVEARTVGASASPATPAPPVVPATPTPGAGGYLAGDGPGADTPKNLDEIPDAVPRNEPLHRYANRPYIALGKTYTPIAPTESFKERGIASWYGKKFHGQRTSSGEVYDMYSMTAAHPTLPIPSYARITNVSNGKSVIVRVNDRGPFLHQRVIDLSYTVAHKLGIITNGSAEVEVESLSASAVTNTIAQADTVQTRPLEDEPASNGNSSPTTPHASTAGNIFLQLGAFKSPQAAESFMGKMRAELEDAGKQVSIFLKDGLSRVQLGPYASQKEARDGAEGLHRKLGFKPVVQVR